MKRALWPVGIILLFILAAVLFRGQLLRGLLTEVGRASGYRFTYTTGRIDTSQIDLTNLRLATNDGAASLTVPHLHAELDLLHIGEQHPYGIKALFLDRPQLRLTHRGDGSWGFHFPSSTEHPDNTVQPVAQVDCEVHDGRLRIDIPDAPLPSASHLSFDGISVQAHLDLTARSRIDGSFWYRGRKVSGGGNIDVKEGQAFLHWHARYLPIADLVSGLVDQPAFIVDEGEISDLDLTVGGIGRAGMLPPLQLFGTAALKNGMVNIIGLAQPLQHLQGLLDMSLSSLTTRNVSGTLLNQPLTLSGGLENFFQPALRLTVATQGESALLRQALAALQGQPISGPLALRAAIEGPITQPTISLVLSSPHLLYRQFAFDHVTASLGYHNNALSVMSFHAGYSNLDVEAGGSLALGDVAQPDVIARARGATATLPLLGQLFPQGSTDAIALLNVEGGRQVLRTVVSAAQAQRHLQGLLALDAFGRPTFGRILYRDGDHVRLSGRLLRDPQTDITVATLAATGMRIQTSAAAGRIDGAVAAAIFGRATLLKANIFGSDLRVGSSPGYVLDTAAADVSGNLQALTVQHLTAAGPGVQLGLKGVAGTEGGILNGSANGDLAVLLPGHDLSGEFSGPVSIVAPDMRHVAVMTPGLALSHGRVDHVALDHAVGSITLETGRIGIDTGISGSAGQLVAAGRDVRHDIGVLVNASVPASLLPKPVQRAHVAGAALLAGDELSGNVLLNRTRIADVPVYGQATFQTRRGTVAITHAVLGTAGVLALANGRADGIGGGRPRYDITAHIRGAELGLFARRLFPQVTAYHPQGRLDADVHVTGQGTQPLLTARMRIPEGAIDGIAFDGGQARLQAGAGGFMLDDGRLNIGRSSLAVSASADAHTLRFSLDSDNLNLLDFDGAFNVPDYLEGEGKVHVGAGVIGRDVRSFARISMHDLEVAEMPVGDLSANWSAQGVQTVGAVKISGPQGMLTAAGTVTPPQRALPPSANSIKSVVAATTVAVHVALSGVDLAARLAKVPGGSVVRGTLNATAYIHGSALRPDVRTEAYIQSGSIKGVSLDRALLQADVHAGTVTIHQAVLDVGGMHGVAQGTVGLGKQMPVAISGHASIPSVVRLLKAFRPNAPPIDGNFSASVLVGGSLTKPQFQGALDFEDAHVAGLSIPRTVAGFALLGKTLQLRDGEIFFPNGSIIAAGTLPLALSPLRIGPANAPLGLDLVVQDVHLSDFAAFIPKPNKVSGTVQGSVAINGTPSAPNIVGDLHLLSGKVSAVSSVAPIDGLNAALRFAGTEAAFDAQASLGGGQLTVKGAAHLTNLTDITSQNAGHTGWLHVTARHAAVVIPGQGSGIVDGSLTAVHQPHAPASVVGTMALHDAILPLSALDQPAGTNPLSPDSLVGGTRLGIAFTMGPNVRIRSGAIDLGADGAARIGGIVAAPTLDGRFVAEGGTLTYLNRSFHVDTGSVSFDPAEGITPELNATADTTVTDPDPDTMRNSSGQARITLTLRGRPSQLNVGLTSEPSYSRAQILGLLLNAPLLGAVDFASAGQNTGAATFTTHSSTQGQFGVSQAAESLFDAQLTQSLLAPLSSAIGGAVGLSDLAINLQSGGTLGFSARHKLTRNLSLLFGDSLGVQTRQSIGLDLEPNDATAVNLSLFQEQGTTPLGRTGNAPVIFQPSGTNSVTTTPGAGAMTSGVSLSLKRRFP